MNRYYRILLILPLALAACGGEEKPAADRTPQDSIITEGSQGTGAADTTAAPEPAIPYDVSPAQRSAIISLLRGNPEWRIAADEDNRHQMLENMRREKPGYRPYFTIHDFNRDGTRDFAITLVRGETFRSYWFRGNAGGYADPVLLVEEDWLDNGGQIISDNGDLLIGEFYSDHLVRFVPHEVTGGLRAVILPPP